MSVLVFPEQLLNSARHKAIRTLHMPDVSPVVLLLPFQPFSGRGSQELEVIKTDMLVCRHEVPGDKALLRLRHYYDSAPEANAGNAAMHLANFALHAVAERSARMQDPRMRSLRTVGHLQVYFCTL